MAKNTHAKHISPQMVHNLFLPVSGQVFTRLDTGKEEKAERNPLDLS